MRKIKNLWFISIVCMFCFQLAQAQENNDRLYSFLQIPVSPRSSIQLSHAVSLANPDLFATISNPAYYDSTFHNAIQLAYYSHFADANYSALGYSYQIKPQLYLTGIIRYMNYGSFDRLDEFGNNEGSFNSYDVAFTSSLSKEWITNFYSAASFTIIRSAIDTYSSHGLTFSLGSYYKIPAYLLSIGFVVRDFGFQLDSFNQQKESVPFDISLGLTKRLKYVPFRFTITAHSLQKWPLQTIYEDSKPAFLTDLSRHLALGGEFLFSEHFNLRFGLNKQRIDDIRTDSRIDLSGTGFGAGIKIKRFSIDLSRTSFSSVGAHYQISIFTQI